MQSRKSCFNRKSLEHFNAVKRTRFSVLKGCAVHFLFRSHHAALTSVLQEFYGEHHLCVCWTSMFFTDGCCRVCCLLFRGLFSDHPVQVEINETSTTVHSYRCSGMNSVSLTSGVSDE